MPLVRIDAREDARLRADGVPGGPAVVLIHGYKFRPGDPAHCPHDHILSLSPRASARAVSWPRHLGFGRGDPDEGLCVAFGWNARGTVWQAHAEAARAGRTLSALVAALVDAGRGPVHLVAHSLGARVALSAFDGLPPRAVGRAILLAGAETRAAAAAALATPAGRTAEVVNVSSGENALFDFLFRAAVHPHRPGARLLGAGLGQDDPRWLDLSIDCPATRARLAARGFRVPPPERPVCHWSTYLRPGLFPLYRALLREGLPLAVLREPSRDGRETPMDEAPLLPA